MERVALTAEIREPGKGKARRARVADKVPAILYGRSVKPLSIFVDRRPLEAAVKTKAGMNVIIDLSVTGGDSGLEQPCREALLRGGGQGTHVDTLVNRRGHRNHTSQDTQRMRGIRSESSISTTSPTLWHVTFSPSSSTWM